MARVTCEHCHMQYNTALGACPNCGAQVAPFWRRVFTWHWPLPLAIGLGLQLLSRHVDLERSHDLGRNLGPGSGRTAMPDTVLVSQFIAGMLVFSLLAAIMLFILERIIRLLRREMSRRRRRGLRRRMQRSQSR